MQSENFRFNPLAEPIDSLPEKPKEVEPPLTYNYAYSEGVLLGDKKRIQVWVTVKTGNGKKFERFEQFLIKTDELEECIKQSIQVYLLKFGYTEDKVLTMFQDFNLDTAKKVSFKHG